MPKWEKFLDEEVEQTTFEKFTHRKKNIKLDGETLVERLKRKEQERETDEQKRIANQEEVQDSE